MDITFYHLHRNAPLVTPARQRRRWMDETSQQYAYRCLPLAMANRAGWEIFCPAGFTATWDGGVGPASITVQMDEPTDHEWVRSHFGFGVLTFHPGYLIKTSEGVALWAMGSPNEIKDGIQALAGIIETPWLPFAFTMNWHFTRPGRVRFEKGEPFAFMTPTHLGELEAAVPVEADIGDHPEVLAAYEAWSKSRREFIAKQVAGDPEAVAQGWQRHYMRGEHPEGTPAAPPTEHRTKVKVAKVRALSSSGDAD